MFANVNGMPRMTCARLECGFSVGAAAAAGGSDGRVHERVSRPRATAADDSFIRYLQCDNAGLGVVQAASRASGGCERHAPPIQQALTAPPSLSARATIGSRPNGRSAWPTGPQEFPQGADSFARDHERAAALGHIAPRMTRVPGGVAGTCFAPAGDMRSLDRVLLVTATTALSLAVASPGVTTRADSRVPFTGGVHRYVTVEGDTWPLLEARFGVDAPTLITDNGLTARRPLPAGLELRVDNRHIVPEALERLGLVINVPQRMLFHDAGEMVMGAPLAVGKPTWRTPLGPFTIVAREEDPTWDVPASIMEEARRAGRQLPASVPPGPSNPLGKYWLGLSIGGVGIHGTNAPSSIYHAVTHGCMRLAAADIAT